MEYFEDITVGEVHEYGSYEVTETEIVEFAQQYDPQPFHVDPAAAADSPFGGLIASGWHTASMCMRLYADNVLADRAGVGARGIDELRWRVPVRPGDELRIRTEVTDKQADDRRPDRGDIRGKLEGLNGDDDVVISWRSREMVARRSNSE
ncbi:MAG: MaoC family dehydratase [Salinirussus sp.]